jgi:hypothetical protein
MLLILPPPRFSPQVEKEDLALPNHLSGLTKTYIKLKFDNTRHLMDVRKVRRGGKGRKERGEKEGLAR